MSRGKVESLVSSMAEQIVADAGMELVDVEFVKEGSHWYLRVYIDKPGGIDLDDCEAVSTKLGSLLDEKDPIAQEYILEVSSPGLDRPLKKPADFERYKGKKVRISTYAPLNGTKEFVGELLGLAEDDLLIGIDGERVAIPRDKAASVRLEFEF